MRIQEFCLPSVSKNLSTEEERDLGRRVVSFGTSGTGHKILWFPFTKENVKSTTYVDDLFRSINEMGAFPQKNHTGG